MARGELTKNYEPAFSEERWYRYWREKDHFHAADLSDKKPFAIVIPPPNVTGMLHMGHALNNVLQDIIIRFKRMQGCNALWMPGMDHAGIATQNVVEQELAREGLTRHDLTREEFIARVWQWKERYGGVIINQLKRLGCSCDWSRERFTMDEGLSRAVREVFVRLYHDGLIYQGDYVIQWCPRCHTAISDLEVEYKELNGHLWNVRYPLQDGTGELVVATTRPETMLGDTAVAVNPEDERFRGMVGKQVILPLVNRAIPIIADPYVSMEFGTGAVKITPACDPNDFAVAKRHNLPLVKIMDGSAIINENGGPYQGQDRYVCRENIVKDLEDQGYLLGRESYLHNIGQCYRCKTDIEPTVSTQWFVRITPLARQAIAAVVDGKTRIIPPSWEATYFEWMNNIRDWCISRQIWWGHRIPVWYCGGCGKTIVASVDPSACPDCGGLKLSQDEDVLDTWFSSALWPFSTLGWPDETAAIKTFYPTSLLVTGFDILFFWVARMMMMGLYVMKEVPFRDVYLHALVRDENGEKMSKSKGNSIDPLEMIDKFGADAFRFTLAAYTAQGRDVRMSEERIEGHRHFVNKIWNAARFSLMNLEDYSAPAANGAKLITEGASLPERWIIHRLNLVAAEICRQFDEYRFNEAASGLYQFIWHEFCDWYLELMKPTLYGKDRPEKRIAAQANLYQLLSAILKLLHPFMPFVTEEIWQTMDNRRDSIMISPYPAFDPALVDEEAAREMTLIMDIITVIRNIRGEMEIPPAKKLHVFVSIPEDVSRRVISAGSHYITHQANLASLTVENDLAEPKGSITGIVGACRIYVLLEDTIDLAKKRAKIEKELSRADKDLEQSSKKLANRDFLAKADPQVIEKEREKHRDLLHRHRILEESLKKFRDIEGSG
ncbi:MAG: valine--tRNA ligase, partial [Smithellaceae bacterium]|nr:valine--tRNA ligase [Smithellaceae bacterium]